MTSAALDLRAQIAHRFPDAVPLPARRDGGVTTGVDAFDGILPNSGLPRGRPTLWATPGAGATAILLTTVQSVLASGQRAAWIDGTRTVGLGWPEGPLMLRPRTPLLGLRFAELLLESGGFALVVLGGVPVERTTLFRLARATHEGGGAFALLTEGTLPAALRVRSRYVTERIRYSPTPFGDPARLQSVTIALDAIASGWQRSTTLTLAVDTHDVRCALDPGLADRRGGE